MKFILLTVFAIFLVHDIIPHIHIEKHPHEYENKKMFQENNEHDLILEHHIDDEFISKKNLNLFFKLTIVAFISPDILSHYQNIDILEEGFQAYNKEQIPPPPILGSLFNKAPPTL